MARSASGFEFNIDFMTTEDRLELAERIVSISPDWCKVEWIYKPEAKYDWERDRLFIEESGIGLYDIEKIVMQYIEFVLTKYPDINTYGYAHYTQLNAEGTYNWDIRIKNNEAIVTYLSAPLDYPCWCRNCEEELGFDINDITADNYETYTYTCPECGSIINMYKQYKITVTEDHYTLDDFK